MKKKIICLGLASVLLMIGIASISSAKVTKLSEINVPEDYSTIQEAIDAASYMDTILVSSGEYHENIIIDKMISLIGDGAGSTSIVGDGTDHVVTTSQDGVELSGFTIKNGGSSYNGIQLGCHYNTIEGTIIMNCMNGFYLYSSTGNQIQNNEIKNNYENGILAEHSHENTIKGNLIDSNENCGILLKMSCLTNHIIENTISNNNNIGLNIIENSYIMEGYHNNFIGNTQHAFAGSSDMNQFDNGEEGNYWDDWDGSGVYAIEGGAVDNYPLSEPYQGENSAPNTPTITGKKSGKTGNEYTYTASSTDPDGDEIQYLFDWDDGSDSGWQSSNAADHTWNSDDTYTVKVKAKDSHGAESDWGTLEVTMPKTANSIIDFLENMLDRFDWPFPMLRVMLYVLGK